jgi:hypothetical protein
MERRKRIRQNVEIPLEIFRIGEQNIAWMETTRNISSGGGVCFRSKRACDVGVRVEYSVTLSPVNPPVKINCRGRVVRCIETGDAEGQSEFEIALTMERYEFSRLTSADGNAGASERRTEEQTAQSVA